MIKNDDKISGKPLLAEVVKSIKNVVVETKKTLDFMRFLSFHTK